MRPIRAEPTGSFARLATRLSTASVRHRWELDQAIDWDAPELRVTADDPRWILPAWDPLGQSAWYQGKSVTVRANAGLWRVAGLFKVGIAFEATLKQGLIAYASTLPDGHPSFQYVYHEIIEEAKHSMMFEEFIRRSALPPTLAVTPTEISEKVARLGATMPALFFLSILTGEAIFDQIQRRSLSDPNVHPLLARVHRLHCEDEARHLSFARATLRELVPTMDRGSRRSLDMGASAVIRASADRMFELPAGLARALRIPEPVLAEVARCDSAVELRYTGLAGVVSLCDELGIVLTNRVR